MKLRSLALAALLGVCVSSSAVAGALAIRTVAVTGDAAPDAGNGVVFGGFNQGPLITADGTVVFETALQGAGVNFGNTEAIYTADADGQLAQVVRGGDAAPGVLGGAVFNAFDLPISGPGGGVLIQSLLPGSLDSLFVQESGGALMLVGLEGQPPTGGPAGAVFESFLEFQNRFDASGGFTGLATLRGPGVNSTNNLVIVNRPAGGELTVFAREGDPIPGAPPGVLFDNFSALTANGNGQIAFTATQSADDNGDGFPDAVVFLADPVGGFQRILAEGQPLPDAPPGLTFGFLQQGLRLNGAGQAVLTVSVDDSNAPLFAPLETAIVKLTGSGIGVVARSGTSAETLGAGVSFERLFEDAVINDRGQVAFGGQIAGVGVNAANDAVILLEGPDGDLNLVAREGDAPPGVNDGATFSDFSNLIPGFSLDFPGLLALNAQGQLAFLAELDGPSVNGSNDTGLFAINDDGELQLVVREGDLFDIDDDPLTEDLRVIDEIDFTAGSGGGDGFSIAFNDSGDLAFALEFTDGTEGLFVVALPVPEPGGFVLVGYGFFALGARRGGGRA